MARQITDVHRPVTVPFPAKKVNWKRLMLWIVLACVVVGGSVGGYYLYDYVTSTVDLPKPPVKPGVVTPATPTETTAPAQSSDQMPVLEVTWEEIKLPPLKYGYDDISGFLVENGGNTISVYRCIGPANNGKATLYSHWKTTDSGKTWNEVEQVILDPNQEKQLGFIPGGSSSGGYTDSPIMNEEESLQSTFNPLTAFYGKPWLTAQDGNNIFVAIQYHPYSMKPYDVFRLMLSLDNGSSWNQLNFPSYFAEFDAYPNTPELTLLKEIVFKEPKDGIYGKEPFIRYLEIISSGENSIQLFMISARGGFLEATIKSPN